MSWFIFAIAASVIWSFVIIIDKHAITDEMKDPVVAATVSGFTLFLLFSLLSTAFNPFLVEAGVAAISFLAGVAYATGIIFYYKSEQKGEVSRIFPLIGGINPILVAVLSTAFLGEILSPIKYAGIAVIIAGSILISLKKPRKKAGKNIFLMITIAAVFYGLRNFFLEVSTQSASIFHILPWVGFGGMAVGVVLLAAHHPHLRRRSYVGIEHLLVSNGLAAGAFSLFVWAVTIAPASLVTPVISAHILFVFVTATLLSKSHPKIIREEMKGSTLLVKSAAIVMILLGLAIIV